MNLVEKTLRFFAWLLLLAGRLFALALFASLFYYYFFVLAVVHMIVVRRRRLQIRLEGSFSSDEFRDVPCFSIEEKRWNWSIEETI